MLIFVTSDNGASGEGGLAGFGGRPGAAAADAVVEEIRSVI